MRLLPVMAIVIIWLLVGFPKADWRFSTGPTAARAEELDANQIVHLGTASECVLRTTNIEYCSDIFIALADLDTYWKERLGWITPAGNGASYASPKTLGHYTPSIPLEEIDCAEELTPYRYCTPALYSHDGNYIAINEPLLMYLHTKGDFGAVIVLAHEWGHHIQTLLGKRPSDVLFDDARFRIQDELQADCYAGLWAGYESRELGRLELGDLDEAIRTAYSYGDHRLIRWTSINAHGLPEQRVLAFRTGFAQAGSGDCTDWGRYMGEPVINPEGFTLAVSPGMTVYPFGANQWIVLEEKSYARVKGLEELSAGALSAAGKTQQLRDALLGSSASSLGFTEPANVPTLLGAARVDAPHISKERYESSLEGRTEHGILYVIAFESRPSIAIDVRTSGVPNDGSWFHLERVMQSLILGLSIK